MPPSTPSTYQLCTQDDVVALLSVEGVIGRADDDADAHLTASETAYATRAIQWATARVTTYCSAYKQSSLQNSWMANWHCTVIAAYLLCCRRGNPVPGSIADSYEEVMEELKLIRKGDLVLADAPMRDNAMPGWINVGAPDLRFRWVKLRQQRAISGRKGILPTGQRNVAADIVGEIERGLP